MTTIKKQSVYFAAGASVLLLLSLYTITRYELQAVNGSLSLTWKTMTGGAVVGAAGEPPQRRTTSSGGTAIQRTASGLTPSTSFHLSHTNSTNSTAWLLLQHQQQQANHAFPRWGVEGIDIATVLDFIFHSSQYAVPPQQQHRRQRNRNESSTFPPPRYIPTNDHANDVGYWFPEVLYVLDRDGLWCSRRHRDILTKVGQKTVQQKLEPVEALLMAATKRLLLHKEAPAQQWPRLVQALSYGIPFLAFYGDFTGCNRFNYNNHAISSSSNNNNNNSRSNHIRRTSSSNGDNNDEWSSPATSTSLLPWSIPLLTTAAAVSCDYAIPFPNYQTISDAATVSNQSFPLWKERYPVASKLRQVVWRGSLTGNVLNDTHKSLRWTVLEMYHNHPSGLFDVGATRLPKRHQDQQLDLSAVGGIVDGFAMEDFQKYQVILDMDGNSWSSRFGKLLCFNSVVLKMKPDHVDYFFYDLVPWVHYIPVNNIHDLFDKARYALDPSYASIVAEITANANAWCRRQMVPDRISENMLSILDRYVQMIDAGSALDWPHAPLWTTARAQIQQPEHPLAMELLPAETTKTSIMSTITV